MHDLCEKTGRASSLLRVTSVCTVAFAILAPVAAIVVALMLTLIEGDWWLNLFLAYFAAIVMLVGPVYIALLTLLLAFWRQQTGRGSDTRFSKIWHRALAGTAVAVLAFSVFLLLILCDVLNGAFALPYFLGGGVLIVLYLVRGVYTLLRRRLAK